MGSIARGTNGIKRGRAAPVYQIQVRTPGGDVWVTDAVPSAWTDRLAGEDETARWIVTAKVFAQWLGHELRSDYAAPSWAADLLDGLTAAGVDPLACQVELVRDAPAGKAAPNGWLSVFVSLPHPTPSPAFLRRS
jgi:hypothetical protein